MRTAGRATPIAARGRLWYGGTPRAQAAPSARCFGPSSVPRRGGPSTARAVGRKVRRAARKGASSTDAVTMRERVAGPTPTLEGCGTVYARHAPCRSPTPSVGALVRGLLIPYGASGGRGTAPAARCRTTTICPGARAVGDDATVADAAQVAQGATVFRTATVTRPLATATGTHDATSSVAAPQRYTV